MSRCLFTCTERASLGWILALLPLLCICGCGEFFATTPIEIETREILSELKQVRESPHIKNLLPALYRGPTKRLTVKDGVKLFYFAKQNTVEDLRGFVKDQLGLNKLNINAATNQMIIHCANDEEADKALEFLKMVDVPPIQVNIDCLVLERFADVTMDWETTIKIDNLFGEKITLGGKMDSSGNLLPAFPGASLREPRRSTFGLDFGYWRNQGVTGHEFRAVVDLLVSRGYLKILMNPTLETVNGKRAKITARDFAPIERIVSQEQGVSGVLPYSLTDFKWVEDFLEVTPRVYADGSISLTTRIQLGSRSKPEGVVQTSIITERIIDINENRIQPGESLIIGGLRKSEQRAVIRGIPFFKDLPIIGILFSSKDAEEKATELIFILTPSISSGGGDHAKLVKQVRDKLAPPEYKRGIGEVITDPLGTGIYTEQLEYEAARADFERIKAEIEKTEALTEVDLIKEKLLQAAEEVLAERTKSAQAKTEAEKAKEEAQSAKTEAEKAKEEAQSAKTEAEKAKQEAQSAKTEAEKAKAETEKAKQETTKLTAEAQKAKAEAQAAKAEAQKAKEDTEKTKAEAEKAKAEAEKARADAEAAKAEAEQARAEAEKCRVEDANETPK